MENFDVFYKCFLPTSLNIMMNKFSMRSFHPGGGWACGGGGGAGG